MPSLRQSIETQIRGLMSASPDARRIPDAEGDAGLFGPASACWRVHGDFTTMMVGGTAALLMQMLHPVALAGVWDHSNFRQDMLGRLRRTARFITWTTYGPTADAEAAIAQVRKVHDRVKGTTPDGRVYSAHDPDLLTWIHVAEVWCFLRAYMVHRDPTFSPAEQDRYFAETALVARKLGARDVPDSRATVQAYLAAMQPALRYDERTRAVAEALLEQPIPDNRIRPFVRLIFDAARELLPDWAAGLHGFARRGGAATRLGVQGLGGVMRWALRNGAESRARRRTALQGR